MEFCASALQAADYHVAKTGSDAASGSADEPFLTIQKAAGVAHPGDTITVHEGIYRERVNPLRGGLSDSQRIVYQAAPGAEVVIKGSEVVTDWEHVQADTWKVTLPNLFFADFNPYNDLIRGDWFIKKDQDVHTGAVYLNGHWLIEAASKDAALAAANPYAQDHLWFAEVDDEQTTIWAQFRNVAPNTELVEINVRQSVFYPGCPGRDYITVRGFTLEHAATPWAPPTAEQIGLIGTHWSKGWVIEENTVRYSACAGVTLGKYGDGWDNISESADAYNRTIERALDNGWSKGNVGSHLVRNNLIAHCGQAGLAGSMGAIFSTIEANEIHHIYERRLFDGAEMGGIKIHAAIDVLISGNYIHHTYFFGIWLDWMAQGTRVTGNLLHDNMGVSDLFAEVNHGPFLVDNNILMSACALRDWSTGGAYVHNLIGGRTEVLPQERETPYHEAHSTKIAGLHQIPGGDSRFINNLFLDKQALAGYADFDGMLISGNLFLEASGKLINEQAACYLDLNLAGAYPDDKARETVTTEKLGQTKISGLPYVGPDGASLSVDIDYFDASRTAASPAPGPFAELKFGSLRVKLWPRAKPILEQSQIWTAPFIDVAKHVIGHV